MTVFKVGDIVEAFGCRGIIVSMDENRQEPIVEFVGLNRRECFYGDGKLHGWHKTPSLKFIERPKKKKKITVWVGISENPEGTDFFKTSMAWKNKEALEEDYARYKHSYKYGIHSIEIEVEE